MTFLIVWKRSIHRNNASNWLYYHIIVLIDKNSFSILLWLHKNIGNLKSDLIHPRSWRSYNSPAICCLILIVSKRQNLIFFFIMLFCYKKNSRILIWNQIWSKDPLSWRSCNSYAIVSVNKLFKLFYTIHYGILCGIYMTK
jgi:hypothetical protein